MQMKKDQLIKRLSMLYRVELFNVFGLPFVYVLNSVVYKQAIGLNSIAAIILNSILLLEGSFFWFCIYRNVTNRNVTKKPGYYFIPFFRIIKPINVLLIGATITVVVLQPFESTFDRVGTIAFLSLAILEYINYFEVQLMYDNKNDLQYLRDFKRLKKAKLKVW
jgi:hypothetical protein